MKDTMVVLCRGAKISLPIVDDWVAGYPFFQPSGSITQLLPNSIQSVNLRHASALCIPNLPNHVGVQVLVAECLYL